MNLTQPGILAETTPMARYLVFSIKSQQAIKTSLEALAEELNPEQTVVGFGLSLTSSLAVDIAGLSSLKAQSAAGIEVHSTPAAIWCWLRGNDRGELFHRSRKIASILAPAFHLDGVVDADKYDDNRDLSGYEDGTENPTGDAAVQAAVVTARGPGYDGSSFVTVQKWVHDFVAFDKMGTAAQDDAIGRHVADNEEFAHAPGSAHVKRTAQESFEPEAFMLRRSMPWSDKMAGGLMFVAFGKSFNAFDVMMSRMLGLDDGVVDGIFQFTRPISGANFWCPPIKDGKLDLRLFADS